MNYIINIGEWKIIFDQVVRDFKNLTVVDINRDEVEQAIYKYLIEQCSKKKGFQQEECCDSINIDTLFTVLDGEHFKSRSLLHLAIQCVHLQMVKLLIMSGIQVNLCGDDHSLIRNPDTHGFIHGDGWTPLHEAVVMDTSTLKNSKAKKAIVEILISSKADINRKYVANKRTPLHELCAKNNNSKK
ncbi:MAG: ankyrin repeat domain-containing protein [Wolbachia endosymbiont of Fragariocoptes setiger]|nr:ankyrin repeat domain-containing protein [Wolbachia endosymbiont of Fragariocoptes setiger]